MIVKIKVSDFKMSENLSNFVRNENPKPVTIIVESKRKKMETLEKEYSIAADESEEKNTFLSWNVSIGDNLDRLNYLAFQILEYALLDVPGAPLMQALLDAGIAFCFRHLSLSGEVKGLLREEHLEIPLEALREALTNALCHRRYDDPRATVSLAIFDDRLEITNPGRLPVPLTPETIKQPHGSYPYNLRIAQVLYLSTNLERWGTGVSRMVELCREQGVPEPEYMTDGHEVKIVFKKKYQNNSDENKNVNVGSSGGSDVGSLSVVQLTERQKEIIKLIKENPLISSQQMSVVLSVVKRTIERDLADLQKKGILIREGNTSAGRWVLLKESE